MLDRALATRCFLIVGFLAAVVVVALFGLFDASLPAAQAAGATRYVVPGGLTTGTCDSWANGCDLQYALNTVAVSGDELWVKTGTYKPTTTTTRTSYFTLKTGVSILGGFFGNETQRDARNWTANPTTLSGDIGTGGDNSDNTYHVVRALSVDRSAVLDGFTISGGNANAASGGNAIWGGGIYVYNGPTGSTGPTLTHLVISGNKAVRGGGVYLYQSSPDMQAITFTNNTATGKDSSSLGGWGGGLYSYYSSPAITNCSFDSNHAVSDQGQYVYGGAAYIDHSNSLTLTNCSLTNNNATVPGWTLENDAISSSGGALYVYYSNSTFSNLTISGNSAIVGGGIYNWNSSPTLTDITFNANTAIDSGGGLLNFTSSPTVRNVTFKNNTAGTWNISAKYPPPTGASNSGGGGLYNANQSNPTIENASFIGNSGGYGGAIYDDDRSNPILRHVTINQNTALGIDPTISGGSPKSAGLGAAIYNIKASHPEIINSVIWGNTNANTAATDQIHSATTDYNGNADDSSAAVTYSDVQGGFAGTGNVNANPLFGSVGTYGGPTEVLPLLPGSPAIDSASNGLASPTTDQRGIARPQGAQRDMGAFESQRFTISKSGGASQTAQINQPFSAALAVSVTSGHGEPVENGQVTFTMPGSGASAVLSANSAIIASGHASITAQANANPGTYAVQASASGAGSVSFGLENLSSGSGPTATATPTVAPGLIPTPAPPPDAPEPSSFAMLATGLLSIGGVGFLRTRFRRK